MNREPRVLYHLTAPPTPMDACDAVAQEVGALRRSLAAGPVMYLHPGEKPQTRWPRHWWGIPQLPAIRRAERRVDLHHVFNPDPFAFPVLRFLRRPVVYSAVSGSGPDRRAAARLAHRVARLVVPSESDCQSLRQLGASNVLSIPPGIDTSRFAEVPPPPTAPWTLLVGSAPWTEKQFQSKGIDALLEAARRRRHLHLVFLWRGLLFEQLDQRVREAGLESRTEVVNRKVDVSEVLSRVHATVVLADDALLVKAYPHSLLESLAAGRPVLVSAALAMADYVSEHGCGRVVAAVSPEELLVDIDELHRHYDAYRNKALAVRADDFGLERFVAAYASLYHEVLAS